MICTEPPDELARRRPLPYRCADGMCGALDCDHCYVGQGIGANEDQVQANDPIDDAAGWW